MENKITVTEKNHGKRLDKFLTEKLPDTTRSQIKKMIKVGEVLINGKKTTVHRFIKERNIISFVEAQEESAKPTGKIKKQKYDRKLFKKIKIISEEDGFLIIEKPSGLLVHPTDKNETNTLVDWLVEKYPNLKKIGEDPARAAIVHRLDKDVSGLMIIPTTQDAFDYFKQQFKDHTIIKKYTALTYGEIGKENDEINFPIGRSKTKRGLFAAHPQVKGEQFTEKDKKAITTFEIIQKYINYTLLEVEIFTGRTHQIRVHMLAYGHPIVGDNLYQLKKLKLNKDINRIFLHASQLIFTDQNSKNKEFKSKIPTKLNTFLKTLKKA